MESFIAEHRPYLIFAGLVLLGGILLGKLLHPKNPTAAAQGTDAAATTPTAEYVPTSTSFITETTSAINSGNVAAPDAPVNVASPVSTSTGPTSTTTVVNPPPPPASSTGSTGPRPSGYASALDARNHIGDNAIIHYFSQFAIPGWVGMWFVAEKWRLPASSTELEQWLNSHGLRDPNTGKFTALMSSASEPANVKQLMDDAYGKPTGGAGGYEHPRHAQPVVPPRGGPDSYLPATHTVRAGQALPDIARMHGVDWQTLYSLNKHTIDSVSASHGHPLGSPWNALFPGTKLVLPS